MERASQHDDPDLKARSDALRRAAGYRVDGRLDPIVRRRSVTRKVLTFLVIALVVGFAIDFLNRPIHTPPLRAYGWKAIHP